MYKTIRKVYSYLMNATTTPDPDCATCGHPKSEHDYHGDCDYQDGTTHCDCDEFVAEEE